MHKTILQWDRSQCSEQVCTCHDDSSPPRFCTGCGCNVASPGHRNALQVIDARDARIAELEGALRGVLPLARGWSGVIRRQYGHHSTASASVDVAVQNARRVLGGGK